MTATEPRVAAARRGHGGPARAADEAAPAPRRRRPAPIARRVRLAAVILALLVTGCATVPPLPQDPHEMVGLWRGWLIKPRSFEWINLDIRDDGTFDLTGEWGLASNGVLARREGRVRFDGSRGWRGTLSLSDSTRGPALKLERDDRTEMGTLYRRPPTS